MDFVQTFHSINRSQQANVLQNSWLLRIEKNQDFLQEEVSDDYFCDGRLAINWSFDRTEVCWQRLGTPVYELFLEGHLYLHDSKTLDGQTNLRRIREILNNEKPEDLAHHIAGGLFVLIIYDRINHELFVLQDDYGAMPVFVWNSYECIYISSNVMSIHRQSQYGLSETSLCPIATVEFLKYGYLPFSDSIFLNIDRLKPGQVLSVACQRGTLSTTPVSLHTYLPSDLRYQSLQDAGEALHKAINAYFARFSQAEYFIGLSGGYDSRLLANYTSSFAPDCLNFGYDRSAETVLASQVADSLNLEFRSESFPTNLPAVYGSDVASRQRIMATLEYAHVSHLQQRVQQSNADFYMDGFIGDVILGSGYFYKKGKSPKELLDYMFLTMDVNEPARDDSFYLDMLYNDPEAIDDSGLSGMMTGGIRSELLKRIRHTLDAARSSADLHLDIVEAAKHYTRGRNLISAGPVSISSFARCACLFVDAQVRTVCLNTDKRLRIGNGLYNYYWRTYLPELSHFRKAGSTGSPKDPGWLYRSREVAAAIGRRTIKPFQEKMRNRARVEEAYFSNDRYMADAENQQFIRSQMDSVDRYLPMVIAEKMQRLYEKKRLSDSLLLRYVTLNSYLSGGKKDV
ncbi:MAG: hypothetical protein ACRBF0_07575 [Calditrichia bacterium]